MSSLLSVNEARKQLLSELIPVDKTQIQLDLAFGKVLSEDIFSPMDLPPFANSQMDGYAARSQDVVSASPETPVTLIVVADIPAGIDPHITLHPGEAARIMTGASFPEGADLVIPVEEIGPVDRAETSVLPGQINVYRSGIAGQFVRVRGQDIKAGEKVLTAGQRLRAQEVGLLAMLGFAIVPVYRRPRIALLSTGNEIVPVEQPLSPGKVHDSNFFVLAALAEKFNAEIVNLGIAIDSESSVQQCLDRAVTEQVDLIVTSAGVSVGVFDYVRKVIADHGKVEFWRVDIRPGKPIAFGNYKNIPLIGLPGNPVSAFIGFEVFVRPAILKLSGLTQLEKVSFLAKIAESIESDGRESYLRCKFEHENGEMVVRLTESHQGSGNLLSLVQANALLIIPAGVKSLPAGSSIEIWMLNDE